MLVLSTVVLGLAVAVGASLAVLLVRRDRRGVPGLLSAAHGLLAIGGLGLLIIAIPGARRGTHTGTASFGLIAAAMLAAAALVGVAMALLHWRRRRSSGPIIGVHATLAVTGFVILAVYTVLG